MGRKSQEVMERETKQFLENLAKHHGNIRFAALAIGIKSPYHWVKDHCERDPAFEDEYEQVKLEQKELLLDETEMALYEKILKEKNLTAIIFFLKTQGQHRGWIEKQHIVTNQEVVDIVFEEVDLLNGKTENTKLSDSEDVSEATGNIQ